MNSANDVVGTHIGGTIRTGRQLRAARALVRLSQTELAREVGTTTRSIRTWERRDGPPSDAPIFAGKVEAAFARRGVVFFDYPTTGVRLSE